MGTPRGGEDPLDAQACASRPAFGNGVFPEDCPDQVFSAFVFPFGVGLRQEPAISCAAVEARLRFHSSLRKLDQGAAHRQVLLPRYPLDLNSNCAETVTLWRTSPGCPIHTGPVRPPL